MINSVLSAPYLEFDWISTTPGNGESGRSLAQLFVEKVRSLKDVRTICDLGCGNGHVAGLLSNIGYDVTGIDASTTGVTLAAQTYSQPHFVRETIDAGLGSRVGLRDFDLVISSDVIEHLYRPSDLLEAAVSLLHPHGKILVGTPYHGYLKNIALSVSGKMDSHFSVLHTGGHIKFFSVRTLSQLVESNGFKDLKFSFYGRAPYLWKNMICQARRA